MLSIGSIVFIHPATSMKFGGRWGKLVKLDGSRNGCLVTFRENGYPYRFSRDEVILLADYINIIVQSNSGLVRHIPSSVDISSKELLPGKEPNTFTIKGNQVHVSELYPVMQCTVCGTDTTHEFSHTCAECSYPID